ncbi:MAG: hypothetical protein WCI54_02675 [Bacteroidia bacterium]
MNNRKLLSALLFLSFFLIQNSGSATVHISGKAPEYAGNSIQLNTLHDFVSEEKIKLGTLRFNSEGEFSLDLELSETTLCFADFDGYHGMIYLEQGKSYEILLPPKRTLTESQKRNPFVKAEQVWFGTANPDQNELNYQIQKFEQEYTTLENKYFDQIFINHSKGLVDTVKQSLDKEFPNTRSVLFEMHKLYRKANLDFALNQGKSAGFMEKYFSESKPNHQLAAYATLFNQQFLNYFNLLANNTKTAEIKNLVNQSELKKLDDYFQKQLHLNPELSHWVLLKSMKDAYYSNLFSKASILKMLDEIKTTDWSNYEQKTAQLIRTQLTWLSSGSNPPALILKNLQGQKVNISEFPNKYIYLHFTDPVNTICRQHLDALKIIATHYPDKLVIINIIPNRAAFKNDSNWPGIFTTTESNIEEIYKVKTYPNSFLIGKDGKLLLSPAPNPIDGLDRQLGQIFKSDYLKELQKPK